ncbi:ABC transporter substrate-binding protein [Cohnella lubricantis]|uniref:Peptide ABC transporter substrate-binding protein n=1 Tax=Cohnella lubricantis TaxID=2163172 RepID=A0A841TE49_9BACL|nr:ABC transporter substrate-binding protein [Cohnella lubricantis]MBB6676721.1 peptide ABC transporter substrate-binding protein [Cohnella lubricantis]MBP2117767.1 peptide/nickel transport system substrate-binding protein [Cohnella lubricantis]
MKRMNKLTVCLSIIALAGSLLAACSNNNNTTNSSASPSPSASASSASPSESPSASPSEDPNAPVDGGSLVIGTFSDIVAINPIYIQDTSSGDVATFALANLYDLDRSGKVAAEPWSLAASLPEISADGLSYTVKLKPEAKWNDGTPVSADDILFTYNTMKNPDAGSPAISVTDKIDTITKVDDKTVTFKLKQVYAPFIYSLYTALAPYHILKDVPVTELEKHPYGSDVAQTVTNGPWKWTEWNKGQYLTFEADPNYWGSVKPHIQKITYKIYADQNTEVQALLTGDIDMTAAVPLPLLETVQGNSDIAVNLAPGPQYEYFAFNFKDENFPGNYSLFKGQKTRQAIAYALNRQGMVDNILKGTGTLMNSPFLATSWANPGDAATNYTYDPEKAKQLLAEDGWVAGKDGILEKDGHKFSFELQYNSGNSRRESVAAVIQQNLKDVGIEVKTTALDFATWVDQNLNPGVFEAALGAWSLSNPDPDQESIFSSKYYPPAGQNNIWYKNEKIDQLWVDGYSTTDQAQRTEIYKQIGAEISADLPYIFLYQYGTPQAFNKKINYAEEDKPEASLAYGQFFHIINWWIK